MLKGLKLQLFTMTTMIIFHRLILQNIKILQILIALYKIG